MAVLSRSDDSYYTLMRTIFFPPTVVITGTFILTLTLLYIFEVVRPGWVGWKRGAGVVLPWLGLTVLYHSVLRIEGEPVRVLSDATDMLDHIHEFNVWFRIPLFVLNLVYLIAMHWVLFHYRKYYKEWCTRNLSSPDNMDISWMTYFMCGLLLISVFYCFIIFRVWYWAYEAHQFFCFTTFAYLLYKGLFQENPYTENFFRETMNEELAIQLNETGESPLLKGTYTDHLEEYKMIFEEWMNERTPYTHMDFKLLDVAVVLPLNRTYLSRFFNDGYNASFSQVVQDYRIRKAQEIFEQDRNITVKDVAKNCGFISLSSFHSAFLKKTGLTPRQYKNSIAVKQAIGS